MSAAAAALIKNESVVSSIAAHRFSRRLLEIGKEFDNNPTMKYLLARPVTTSKGEQLFYDKVLGSRSRFVPLHYSEKDDQAPELRSVSFQKSIRELLETPKLKNINEEEKEKSMWNVFKAMLNVVTCYDNMPTQGYIYDEKFTTYASEPVRNYILNARERLANRNSNQMVKLAPTEVGMALIAHPLCCKENLRNTVLQTYNFRNNGSSVSSIIMNSYKRTEDVLRREGGNSQAAFVLQLDDLTNLPETKQEQSGTVSLTTRGMFVTFRSLSPAADTFSGMTIMGEGLQNDIREGKWIPVFIEKEVLLKTFQFSALSSLECNILKRIYWEEMLRHMGGEFDAMAALSASYVHSNFLKKPSQ